MVTVGGYCWVCQMPVWHNKVGICWRCEQAILGHEPLCLCCGLPAAPHTRQCGRCRLAPPLWSSLIPASDYQNPLRKLLYKLKFNRQIAHRYALSRLILLSYLNTRRQYVLPKPDLLLPVPLHHQRQWLRGFNQCHLLAKPLAKWINCDYCTTALVRNHQTGLQHQLSSSERAKNLQGAYQVKYPLTGQNIALLDDVVTTGHTVQTITRLLLDAKAASVQVLCLCRTL